MISIDTDKGIVILDDGSGNTREYGLDTPEAFALISEVWLRAGWDTKYVYTFSWLGRPIIQLPDDMVRVQEMIFQVKPDVIIETGVAHGGSLIFYASLCKVMEKGRVIGVDIEIRPHNRTAIEAHPLFPWITLIEGNSIAPDVVEQVKSQIKSGDKVFVLLDAKHTKDHVLAELTAYAPLVTVDSYIIAADGIMQQVVGAPRTEADWGWNNPQQAVREFLTTHSEFVLDEPEFPFNESVLTDRVTYWPNGLLKRVR